MRDALIEAARKIENIETATIERCELAVKNHPTMTDRAKHQAIAAIMALKE